jgi:ribonuclease III
LSFFKKLQFLFLPKDSFQEKITSITGIYPSQPDLYRLAFRHSSLSSHPNENNERLEFLGDSVFNLVIADFLIHQFPSENEGKLTEFRSMVVSRSHLNDIAKKLHLDVLIEKNRKDFFTDDNRIAGNTLEALIGAIYISEGFDKAKKFIEEKIMIQHVDFNVLKEKEFNYKSRILEWAQQNSHHIEFILTEEKTSGTSKNFSISIHINNEEVATGEGPNKKSAEKAAAEAAYKKLGI